jgi:beta-glucosidase
MRRRPDRTVVLAAVACVVACAAALVSASGVIGSPAAMTAAVPVVTGDERADSLLFHMSLADKIKLLEWLPSRSFLGQAAVLPGAGRLGLPPLRLARWPEGLVAAPMPAVPRPAAPGPHPPGSASPGGWQAVAMTSPLAVAATFSRRDAYDNGAVTGRQARALGVRALAAPLAGLDRDPAATSGATTFGEDPLLAGQTAAAEVSGLQRQGTMAVVTGYPAGAGGSGVVLGPAALHELYAQPWQDVIQAGAAGVMCSPAPVRVAAGAVTATTDSGPSGCDDAVALSQVLRGELGFTGFTVSGSGAGATALSLDAGLDSGQPAGPRGRAPGTFAPAAIEAAVGNGTIPVAAVNRAAGAILAEMDRFGMLTGGAGRDIPAMPAAAVERVAQHTAEDAATLLKDEDRALPLPASAGSVALIGPGADGVSPAGPGTGASGQAGGAGQWQASTYQALRADLAGGRAAHLTYAVGDDPIGSVVPAPVLSHDGQPGLIRTATGARGAGTDALGVGLGAGAGTGGAGAGGAGAGGAGAGGAGGAGTDAVGVGLGAGGAGAGGGGMGAGGAGGAGTGADGAGGAGAGGGGMGAGGAGGAGTGGPSVVPVLDNTMTGGDALPAGTGHTWAGELTAPVTGTYTISIGVAGARCAVSLDGAVILRAASGQPGALPSAGGGLATFRARLALTAGTHTLNVSQAPDTSGHPVQVRLSWLTPVQQRADLAAAVAAARSARAAVVFAWSARALPPALPDGQDRLIAAVAAANPHTIVVLNTTGPVAMPWLSRVKAVLQMWLPGGAGGQATANVLLGRVDPAGRLPFTWPASPGQNLAGQPSAHPERTTAGVTTGGVTTGGVTTGGAGAAWQRCPRPAAGCTTAYSEGIYMGYRWYDEQGLTPLFPFGYGLSYTRFRYSRLGWSARGGGLVVRFGVTNTGPVAGEEVPQVYLGKPAHAPAGVTFAAKALAAYTRISLRPGQTAQVTLRIPARQLQYWDDARGWVTAAGPRALDVGPNERTDGLTASVEVPR